MVKWNQGPLLTWAPNDNGQAQRVAGAIRDLLGRNKAPPLTILAVPLDPYPGYAKVSDITKW